MKKKPKKLRKKPQKRIKRRLKRKIKKEKPRKVQKKPIQSLPVEEEIKRTKIKVIGIGGGGGSIVSEIAARLKKSSFLVANTDLKALKTNNRKATRLCFGQSITHGLGTGMNPELGRVAALSEKEKIKKNLEGQDLCIFVACLGGGTGSGATPIFAKIARDLGSLTFGLFTLPFQFEGEKKMEIAKESLKKIKGQLNAFSIIPNERVFQTIDKSTPLKQALSLINRVLSDSLQGLIETIYEPGLINIDFADFRTILEGRGRLAYLNTVEVQKRENSVKDLTDAVLHSSLYPYTIKGAKGILFNIASEKNLSLSEVSQISSTISGLSNPEAKIIFGVEQAPRFADRLKITLLATGCGLKIFSKNKPTKTIKKRIKRFRKRFFKRVKNGPKKEKPVPEIQPVKIKKKISSAEPKNRKRKVKKIKATVPHLKRTEKTAKPKEILVQPSPETIRKNGLQIKRETEEMEKEILEKEKFWETPAFLRKKIN